MGHGMNWGGCRCCCRRLVVGWASDAAAKDKTGGPTAALARSHGGLSARQRARLSAAVRRGFREAAAPGVIVGVRTPKGQWVTAVGIANQRSKAPMRANMHQRIGSVTKTFMGTLLMQLAGEHKLSLDDKVSKYINGVPNGDTMTLRQVADMTSGVASYTADPAFMKALYAHPDGGGGQAGCWRSAFAIRPCSPREPLFKNTPTATTSCSGW